MMLEANFKAWGWTIKDLCANGRHHEAVRFFLEKSRSSIAFKPNHLVVSAVLKSCTALSNQNYYYLGRAFHASLLKQGHLSCLSTSKALLNMYAKSGALSDCHSFFDHIDTRVRDTVVWNILLSGLSASKDVAHDVQAVKLFNRMARESNNTGLSSVSFSIILPVCGRLGDWDVGRSVHCLAVKTGLDRHTLVGNALVSMHAKCGVRAIDDSYAVFTSIDDKDVVSWNAVIAGFAENKLTHDAFRMFTWMLKGPKQPNCATIASILPVCASLDQNCFGREIHSYVLRRAELASDNSVCNSLITFYLRTGQMEPADCLFSSMESRDLVSWNAAIAGFTLNGECSKALKLFLKLLSAETLAPDSVTLVSVLPASAYLQNLQLGRQIHAYVLKCPTLCNDTAVANSFINFYTNCNDNQAALKTFLMLSRRDLISWNSILDAFSETEDQSQFLDILEWMFTERIKPDSVTILILISFSISVFKTNMVKEIHGYSIRSGLLSHDAEPTIANAMIDGYAKCGDMDYALNIFQCLSDKSNIITFNSIISGYLNSGSPDDAHKIFNRMCETNLTTWNLMVRIYTDNGNPDQALNSFYELQYHGMKPDEVTVMSLLPACVQINSIRLLKECHGFVVRNCSKDVMLEGTLLDAYAKCGALEWAYKLFTASPSKDLVMFTSMISGFAMHGMGEEALKVFHQMIQLGLKPDRVIFTSVLSACSHAGLIDEGLKIFYTMERVHGMIPAMEQYACVVDLLARGGRVNDAYTFVTEMPVRPNANIWSTLLGACRTHHKVELGRVVADHLFEIEADNIGNYVVMSNLYAADARWDGVLEMRKLTRTRDLKKPAGCSWIEVERKKNVFIAGDCLHPQRGTIYAILHTIDLQIKDRIRC